MKFKKNPPLPFLDRFLGTDKTGHPGDFVDIIIRDVEALFNTRCPRSTGGGTFEAGGTVIDYGLPDMTATGCSEHELWSLALEVRKSLEIFEPRLSNIQVEPVSGPASVIDHLTVKITAVLKGFEDWPPLSLEMPWPV